VDGVTLSAPPPTGWRCGTSTAVARIDALVDPARLAALDREVLAPLSPVHQVR
jgi:hypothetical protein